MMKRVFNWLVDKWLAGFITASIFFTLKLYLDLPQEAKANFFKFNWLSEILKTKLSLTTVIIITAIIIFITRIEKSILNSKGKSTVKSLPKDPQHIYRKYRRDTFGVNKTIWTWNYEWIEYEEKFQICDLKPVCKQCGTPMEIDNSFYSSYVECFKCRLDGRYSNQRLTENIADVSREIIRRIQNNEVDLQNLS